MGVKAVILGGGESLRPYPLGGTVPKPLLPFLGHPLLELQILALRDAGLCEIGVAVSARDRTAVEERFGSGTELGVRLAWRSDDIPSGPAGCLRLFADHIREDTFLVIEAGTIPGTIDLGDLIGDHTRHAAPATLAMVAETPHPSHLESVIYADAECVDRFEILHPSSDRRSHKRFAGIYVFSPQVIELIPPSGYADIKEQLIPELSRRGPVRTHLVDGVHARVDTVASYFRGQQEFLAQGLFDAAGFRQTAHQTWVGDGARVDDSARLVGPVVIGHGCTVAEGACIVGPSVIGDRTFIGPRALVRESILWEQCRVSDDARVEYSIVGSHQKVGPTEAVKEAILMPGGSPAAIRVPPPEKRFVPVRNRPAAPRFAALLSRATKRVIDVTAATILLILLSPVMAITALAIWWDTPGPILFIQRRCGRGGREFRMFKFRTMVSDADRMQHQLQANKSVDGPMFKIFNDPRLTRVGAFLRRNSIDELPQLWNVLKGDMSLVGPRPLVMSEMRLSPGWRDIRLSVKPGITGIWQVNGRSQTGFHDWIRHDVAYVKNWSLWLDIKILMKTVVWVLSRTGAC